MLAISGLLTCAPGVWESTPAVKHCVHTKRLLSSPTASTNRVTARMASDIKDWLRVEQELVRRYE